MASSTSAKQGSARRLSDLLDQQQEPFVLEIHLHERGYRIRKSLEFEGTNIGCCSATHDHYKNTKKFVPKKSSAQFSNMAKTLLNKLVLRKKPRKRREKEVDGSTGRCCSSVTCWSTMSNNTCSPTNKDTTHHDKSNQGREMNQWRVIEENNQWSPDSVLDEIDLIQAMSVYNVRQTEEQNPAEPGKGFQKKVSENAILSASLWELLVHFRGEKSKQLGRRKSFPEYMNSTKTLQKDGLLLFDCVREAVENGKQLKNSIRNREKSLKMGFMCKSFKVLGKLSTDKTNIQKVLRKDLLEKGVDDEWNGFEVWKRKIVAEIGDSVVDEVTDEIISELSDQYFNR